MLVDQQYSMLLLATPCYSLYMISDHELEFITTSSINPKLLRLT